MGKIIKSLLQQKGITRVPGQKPHRAHRSKKGRKNAVPQSVKLYKLKKEQLKVGNY